MSDGEPHGFAFDHVARHPSSSSRQPRSSPAADAARPAAPRSRSSFRISSLRNALFAPKNANGRKCGADKTPTASSGVLSSLFGRQTDSAKSPPGGDLWVDVDLDRPAPSPSLDDLSVTSSMTPSWADADRCPEAEDGGGGAAGAPVAVVRRSNSARPATRRPLPIRVAERRAEDAEATAPGGGGGGGGSTEAERRQPGAPAVAETDLWTQRVSSPVSARLSGDSGLASCKLGVFLAETNYT